jgi:hypothetical protein
MMRRRAGSQLLRSCWFDSVLPVALKSSTRCTTTPSSPGHLPAATLQNLNISLRSILAPNSAINTAKGRLEAAAPTLALLGSVDDVIPPLVALEILRLLVDNLDHGSLLWLETSNSPQTNLPERNTMPSTTTAPLWSLANCSRLLLRSLVGFLDHGHVAAKHIRTLQPHALRLLVGCPMLCRNIVPSDPTHETLQADVASLVRGVCESWGDRAVTAHKSGLSRPVLKYVPSKASVLLPAVAWASRVDHAERRGLQPLYLMALRAAYLLAASSTTALDVPLITATFGWGSTTAAVEREDVDKAARSWVLSEHLLFPLLPPHADGEEGGLQRRHAASLLHRLRNEERGAPFITTVVTIHDDIRMRQVLLQLAKWATISPGDELDLDVGISLGSAAVIVVNLAANRTVDIEAELRHDAAGDTTGVTISKAVETYLRCLLSLKSWLDLISNELTTRLSGAQTHRVVGLSFQFVSTMLTLCITELRHWMLEDPKRLLDQKPRVHLVKDTAELVQRLGPKVLFPELDAASEETQRACDRTLRDILHNAKFLVRKVMSLKGSSLKEEGTLGALLTGGVDHNHIKQDDMLRNAAYRVIEPLLTRWYRAVDPSGGLSWSYRRRGGDALGRGGDILEVVQEIHHHVGIGELVSGAELLCLRHPMQHTLVTLLEMWRCVCFRATVVGTVVAQAHAHNGAEASWRPVLEWIQSSAAPLWRDQWSASNLLRCADLLHSSLDSLLQRLEDETAAEGSSGNIPARLIMSHGIFLSSAADALSNCTEDLGYLPTTRQTLLRFGDTWSHRVRQYPDIVPPYAAALIPDDDETMTTPPSMPGGDHLSSTLDMWALSEARGLPLQAARTIQNVLLQRNPSNRGDAATGNVLVASTLDRFLEVSPRAGGTVISCWSQWALSCQPLRLYDEDKTSLQSKDVFEYGAAKLLDAVASAAEDTMTSSATEECDDEDSTAQVDKGLSMPLRNWRLQYLSLEDELVLRLV